LQLGLGIDFSAAPGGSVLDALNDAVGPLPRIALYEPGTTAAGPPERPSSPEMPALADRPARLHLFGEIARGGMGAILHGRDAELGREVAVKVLLEQHQGTPALVRRFIEEAQISGQLQHPGVVPVYELGTFGDRCRPYFAMKLVKGHTLAALLADRPDPLDEQPRLLSVFHQVAQTVAYAHARGVIHRDLKPSNIMVGDFGEVQVMDWGLAKVLPRGGIADDRTAGKLAEPETPVATARSGSDAGLSAAGSIMGTPAYMPPEQARGETERLDERCDVFALGSILCEILTGRPAFTGRSSAEIQRKAAAADQADALARLDACGADAELLALAKDCLAAEPRDRPRDAHAVASRVTDHLAGVQRRLRDAELARVEAQARAAEERKRRWLTIALAASVLGTALAGAGGWARVASARAGRTVATTSAVSKALDDALAARARARARSAPPGDWSAWIEATEACKRADSILASGDAPEDWRDRVRNLREDVAREYSEARARAEAAWAEARDRRMVERLAEIHADISIHQDAKLRDEQFAAAFRDYGIDVEALEPAEAGARIAARPIAVELAGGLENWAHNRRARLSPRDLAGARRLLAIAKVADPDPWRNQLRDTFGRMHRGRGEALDELRRLAASADPANLPVPSVNRLAVALGEAGDPETAVSLLRVAQRVHPDEFWLTMDLARFLRVACPEDPDDAIRFITAAVSLRPGSDTVRAQLGAALSDAGRREEAHAVLREAIRVRPDNLRARALLCDLLIDMGRAEDAIAVLSAVHQPDPGRAGTQPGQGNPRMTGRRSGGAPGGNRSAAEPGTPRERPDAIADRLVRRREWLIALDARLPALLRGDDRPRDAAERAGFAELCFGRQLFVTSARLWKEAFATPPERAEAPIREYRFHAARAAARAGCSQGKDDLPPDVAAQAELRCQARDWLRADLADWSAQRDPTVDAVPREVRTQLARWRTDPDLACVRDLEALAKLPEPEREGWNSLWATVGTLLARGHPDAMP
jgi:serine/threonine-protein kinase